MSLLTGNARPYKGDIIRAVHMEAGERGEIAGETVAVKDGGNALFQCRQRIPHLLVVPARAMITGGCSHTAGRRCPVR